MPIRPYWLLARLNIGFQRGPCILKLLSAFAYFLQGATAFQGQPYYVASLNFDNMKEVFSSNVTFIN